MQNDTLSIICSTDISVAAASTSPYVGFSFHAILDNIPSLCFMNTTHEAVYYYSLTMFQPWPYSRGPLAGLIRCERERRARSWSKEHTVSRFGSVLTCTRCMNYEKYEDEVLHVGLCHDVEGSRCCKRHPSISRRGRRTIKVAYVTWSLVLR